MKTTQDGIATEGKPTIFSATLSPAEVLGLRQDLDAERQLCMAVMRVSAEKDKEYESLRRNRNAWRVVAVVAAAGHLLLAVVAAKMAGWV